MGARKSRPYVIGPYLKALRIKAGMTRQELWDKLNFCKSWATFRAIESGIANVPGTDWLKTWLKCIGITDIATHEEALKLYVVSRKEITWPMHVFPLEDRLRLVALLSMCRNRNGTRTMPVKLREAIDKIMEEIKVVYTDEFSLSNKLGINSKTHCKGEDIRITIDKVTVEEKDENISETNE